MKKKRSIGVTIISRLEMVAGALGILLTIPFLWIACFGSKSDGRVDGLAIALTWGIPAITLLVMGELTFRLKPAGRIMHLIIPVFVIILYTLQFTEGLFSILLPSFDSLSFFVSIAVLLFPIYFFTRYAIKEQFK